MLPGKTYTPEDILRIGRKRIWFLLLPFAVVSAGTAVWVRTLPDRYRSDTAIQVEAQRVPESYVRSTVTTRLEDRLQSLQAQILNRTRLERIINEFNLYEKERKTEIMQDVVERMRVYDIRAEVLRGDVFRISFQGENARTVAKVTEKLASLFIDENMGQRARMAEQTSVFIEGQLEDAKRRLLEQEKKVEEYKLRNAGQLPSQLESNMQGMQNTRMQLQDVMQAINRGRDAETRFERDIADLEQQIEDTASAPALAPTASGASPATQLAVMNDELAALRLSKTDSHPEVRKLKAAIAEFEQKMTAPPQQDLDAPVSVDLRRLPPAEAARRRRLEDARLELKTLQRNLENWDREQQRLKREIESYQRRNEGIPVRETEMTELLRDYETLNSVYLGLLAKKEDSKMAAKLESQAIGEQFTILDAARVPERPFSPDRQLYNGLGAAGGLAIGLLLVALLEYRDRSFKTDEEVTRVLGMPVLAVVPFMQSAVEQKRALRNRVLIGVGFGSTVVVCLSVVVYTLVR